MTYPAIMPPSPATEPTERSMPPASTTKVMPIARIADIATCLARMDRLFTVIKLGASDEKRTSRRTRTRIARARSSRSTNRAELVVRRSELLRVSAMVFMRRYRLKRAW